MSRDVQDPLQAFQLPSKDWGKVMVAPLPIIDGKWGVLEPIRETPWGKLIPIVPGEVMAKARVGHIKPLMQILGRPSRVLLQMIPAPLRICDASKRCMMFQESTCQPCEKLPDCYEPPGLDTKAAQEAARLVALAWREGIYVVIVDGPEFSF